MTRCRVVIVDDNEAFREALRQDLDAEGGIEIVGVAGNGVEALSLNRACAPEVVLMDLDMPVMGGCEATALLRRESPAVKILALTASTEDPCLLGAIRAGVDGYVVKAERSEEVAAAIRAVTGLTPGAVLSPTLTARLFTLVRQGEDRKAALEALRQRLTRQEFEALRVIDRTNDEVAAVLSIETQSARNLTQQLYRKLRVQTRGEAVQIARSHDLLSGPSAAPAQK